MTSLSFFFSLHLLFWNQTLTTRADSPVISVNCSFIRASGRGLALGSENIAVKTRKIFGAGRGGVATCSKSLGCSTVSQWGQSSPCPLGSSSLSPWLSSARPPGLPSLAMVRMQDRQTFRFPQRPDWVLREDRGRCEVAPSGLVLI